MWEAVILLSPVIPGVMCLRDTLGLLSLSKFLAHVAVRNAGNLTEDHPEVFKKEADLRNLLPKPSCV